MTEHEAADILIENGGMRIRSIPLNQWFAAVRLARAALFERAERKRAKYAASPRSCYRCAKRGTVRCVRLSPRGNHINCFEPKEKTYE